MELDCSVRLWKWIVDNLLCDFFSSL